MIYDYARAATMREVRGSWHDKVSSTQYADREKAYVFEPMLSGQAAAIRLAGSVCYYSLCDALGIDVPWSAVGRRLGRPTATAEPRR
jgi:hypothetical protein